MPKTRSEEITPIQQKVLDFVRDRLSRDESIKLRDIADYCGWSSTATAAGVIRNLRARRLLRRNKRGGRGLTLLNQPLGK